MAYRNSFLKKIWNCCRTLFTLGLLERRDAYSVLSLYLSFFSCTEGPENPDVRVRVEEFDITAEREFWDEIKRGLVISALNFPLFIYPCSVGDNHSTSDSVLCLCYFLSYEGVCQRIF